MLVELSEVVRRSVRARTADPHLVEDVTQETIVRVASVEGRLTADALRAYAVVTARNVLNSHYRNQATARRHAHRLVEYTSLGGPEQLVLEREETEALAVALQKIEPGDRQLLIQHESDGDSLDVLADRHATTARAIAMRLVRARAVLRVEFVLAFRHLELPTSRCRAVLIAMSAGDKRRQDELGTAEHLLGCGTCSSLVTPIVQRHRSIAGWILLPAAELVRRLLGSARHSRVGQAAAVATLAVVATGATLVLRANTDEPSTAAATSLGHTPQRRPEPVATPTPTTAAPEPVTATAAPATAAAAPATAASPAGPAATIAPIASPPESCAAAADLSSLTAAMVGCGVEVGVAAVSDVPADEGFWIEAAGGQRVWVHLVGPGESAIDVVSGQTISFRGVVRANDDPSRSGAPPAPATASDQHDFYIEVRFEDVAITTAGG